MLSSWHMCVPHYVPFPKMGAVVECTGIILFPISLKGNGRVREGLWLTQGQVALQWSGVHGFSRTPSSSRRRAEDKQAELPIRKLWRGGPSPECQEGCSEKQVEGLRLGKSLPYH